MGLGNCLPVVKRRDPHTGSCAPGSQCSAGDHHPELPFPQCPPQSLPWGQLGRKAVISAPGKGHPPPWPLTPVTLGSGQPGSVWPLQSHSRKNLRWPWPCSVGAWPGGRSFLPPALRKKEKGSPEPWLASQHGSFLHTNYKGSQPPLWASEMAEMLLAKRKCVPHLGTGFSTHTDLSLLPPGTCDTFASVESYRRIAPPFWTGMCHITQIRNCRFTSVSAASGPLQADLVWSYHESQSEMGLISVGRAWLLLHFLNQSVILFSDLEFFFFSWFSDC